MAEEDGIEPDANPAELTDLARLLVDSWNRGDARAFACLFTPAAEYVTGSGGRIRGRKAISALVDKASPAARVSVVGQPVVRCDIRSAEVTFMWSRADAGGGPRRGSITCACISHGSGWLIDQLHNNEAGDVAESRGSPTRS